MNITAAFPVIREATKTHVEITHDLANTGTKSCCLIARQMIAAGADPERDIEFTRGQTPVFDPRPLRWWADRRVREADQNGPMRFERVNSHDQTVAVRST